MIMLAIKSLHIPLVRAALAAGADVNATTPKTKMTGLMWIATAAWMAASEERVRAMAMARYLLTAHTLEVNARNSAGMTAYTLARISGHDALVQMIADAGGRG